VDEPAAVGSGGDGVPAIIALFGGAVLLGVGTKLLEKDQETAVVAFGEA
jgi:hypothetical protein